MTPGRESSMNQIKPQPQSMADVWERWAWVWSAIFYVALAASLVLAFMGDVPTRGVSRQILFWASLSAVWHLLGAVYLVRRLPDFRAVPWLMSIYLVGAFGMWWLLIGLNPAFYFMLFGLYGQIFAFLPLRWAVPGAVLLAALVVSAVTGDEADGPLWLNPTFWLFQAITASGLLIAAWLNAIISQSVQRRELIEVLQATQADLAWAEREAGILAERQRLANEIHDTLAQGFASIVVHLEASEQALPPGATAAQQHLDQARRVARDSLAEARGLVWALQPERLQRGSLPEAVARVAQQWSAVTGIPAGVTITGDVRPLPPQAEVALLRAAQEALTNAGKYAAAREVAVTLSYMGDVVVLDVQDDGRGFDPAQLANAPAGPDGSFGLSGMRERAAQLGGTVEIESAPGEGTTVVVEIPLS